jgi:hypothetical protein
MHITVVFHGESKDFKSFERTSKVELLKIEGVKIIGFLCKPTENEVTDMIKKKKSKLLLFDQTPRPFVEKTARAVLRKFNGSSPSIMIYTGESVAGIEKVKNLSAIELLEAV